MSALACLRHPAFWLLPVVFAGYFWLASAQLGAPFAWDEVNFYWNAQAIAERGVPYANAGFLGDRGVVGGQYQYGLWHPPLYLYTLGLGLKLFGGGEAVARGVGVVVMAATALAIWLLARSVIPAPAREWGALLAVVIFLLSPLVVQSALVLDIDGTVLTLALAVWSLAYLRLEGVRGRWWLPSLAVLVVLFAVALWAKLTTPFALLGVALIYQTLRGRPLLGLLHFAVVGVFGGLLFWYTWAFACQALGMPFEMPFQVTWMELHDALGSGGGEELAERLETQALPIVAWVSPYLAALFVGAAVGRVAALARNRRLEPVDFLLGFGAAVGVVYFIKLAAGFPKYHIAMMPFWAVVIAYWIAVGWARLPRNAQPVLLVLAAEGALIAWWYTQTFVHDSWLLQPRNVESLEALGLALLLGFFLVQGALFRTAALAAPLAAMTLALYAGWAASTDWQHTQATYSTNYWYGSTGQRQMAVVVDGLLKQYDIAGPYIGAKEVVVYTDNHFFLDQDTVYWLWGERGEPFDGRLLGYDIPLVVAWVRDPWVRHVFTERLAERYLPMAEVGDYLTFMRRSLLTPSPPPILRTDEPEVPLPDEAAPVTAALPPEPSAATGANLGAAAVLTDGRGAVVRSGP